MGKLCPTPVKWAVAVLGILLAAYSLLVLDKLAQHKRKTPQELSGLANQATTEYVAGLSRDELEQFKEGLFLLSRLGSLHCNKQFTRERVKALVDAASPETLKQVEIAIRIGGDSHAGTGPDVTRRELWRATQRELGGGILWPSAVRRR